MKLRLLSTLLFLAFVTLPVSAQDAPQRNPASLASRYLNVTVPEPVLTLPDPYEPGVTTSQFWTAKQGETLPQQVSAVLASGARVSPELPGALVWVEAGLEYDEAEAQAAARALAAIFAQVALRANYTGGLQMPDGSVVVDPSDLMPIPDVDGDNFIHVLYMHDLADQRDAIFNPMDGLPAALVAGGFANARDVIYVNTTPYSQATFDDSIYLSSIATTFAQMILANVSPHQSPWLQNMLIADLRQRLSGSGVSPGQVDSYLDVPLTSITHMPIFSDASQINGGQQLFLTYLRQRFGENIVRGLFAHADEGAAALDSAIADAGVIDPVIGALPTGRDIFADFASTNILNALFGDGRFAYANAALDQGEIAAATEIALDDSIKTAIAPYGVGYYFYTASEPQTIEVQFTGAQAINRLPDSSREEDNNFYLANQLPDTDSMMTRSVDLTSVDAAELTFDALYTLADGWNYGYVSVSTDGGETWEALPTADGTYSNPHGAAYGPGFTGISSPDAPRPFPIIGIVLGGDGVTIGDLSPGGPAQQAGIQIGDVLVGVNGELWQTAPDILDVLADYAPGHTIVFNVQRGSRRLAIPVLLGAHPTRMVIPESEWMAQTVDLTPYAGQEILLRFEIVTLPGYEETTYALDNLAIEAINWHDDGASPDDWTLAGWSSVSERVPAEWLLTAVHTGDLSDHPPRVERILSDGDVTANFRAALGANETLVLVVSALNTDTTQPAAFELLFSAE